MHGAVALANTTTVRPIHADGMDLIAVGHCTAALGEIADRMNRSDVAVPGIKALEHDQLWSRRIGSPQKLFEVAEIIVAPNFLLTNRLSYTLRSEEHTSELQTLRHLV